MGATDAFDWQQCMQLLVQVLITNVHCAMQTSGFGADISGAASKAGDKAQGAAQKVLSKAGLHACN